MSRKTYSLTSPTERAAIGRADNGHEYQGCRLYLNGVGPVARHCAECDVRLYLMARASRRSEYRIREHDGRIISDWRI